MARRVGRRRIKVGMRKLFGGASSSRDVRAEQSAAYPPPTSDNMNLRLDDVGGLDPRGSGSAGSGLAALFSSEPEEDFNSLTFQHNRAPPSVLHKKKVEPPAAAEAPGIAVLLL